MPDRLTHIEKEYRAGPGPYAYLLAAFIAVDLPVTYLAFANSRPEGRPALVVVSVGSFLLVTVWLYSLLLRQRFVVNGSCISKFRRGRGITRRWEDLKGYGGLTCRLSFKDGTSVYLRYGFLPLTSTQMDVIAALSGPSSPLYKNRYNSHARVCGQRGVKRWIEKSEQAIKSTRQV